MLSNLFQLLPCDAFFYNCFLLRRADSLLVYFCYQVQISFSTSKNSFYRSVEITSLVKLHAQICVIARRAERQVIISSCRTSSEWFELALCLAVHIITKEAKFSFCCFFVGRWVKTRVCIIHG